jgi:hypothetical protein
LSFGEHNFTTESPTYLFLAKVLIPGFYVTQSRKERWKLENPLFLRKMEQFRPIFHHFYAKIAMLGRNGKGSNERLAGSDFHPVGERNVAGGSHVKILNP